MWVKTFYGWTRLANGRRYNISRYRAGANLESWAYVVRVDGSALTSPPVARTTLRAAKADVDEHIRVNS